METKTGKRGFLGLLPTGKHTKVCSLSLSKASIHSGINANVFIRIHDTHEHVSEIIELDKSLKHKKKFERGQIDEFDIGCFFLINL